MDDKQQLNQAEDVLLEVEAMRDLQRRFYAGQKTVLKDAKAQEKLVDKMLKEYRSKNPKVNQQTLF